MKSTHAHEPYAASGHAPTVHLIQGEFPVTLCKTDSEDWPCAAERERLSSRAGGDS